MPTTPWGRLTATTDVFGLTLTYGYDNANRVTEVDDSKGGVLTNAYDNADRLTMREFGGAGQTQALVSLTYSARDELTGVTRYNDVAMSTLAGTTSYSYDDAGRTAAITAKNAAGATLSYYNYALDQREPGDARELGQRCVQRDAHVRL